MRIDKRPEKEEVIEGEEVQTAWDVKKILIGGVLVILIFIFGSYYFLPKVGEEQIVKKETLGISDEEEVPPLPDKEDVENILNDAQDSLSQITSENLTSSQAAIQKIISDLKSLQEDKSIGGVFCDLVCKKE